MNAAIRAYRLAERRALTWEYVDPDGARQDRRVAELWAACPRWYRMWASLSWRWWR